MWTDRSDYWLPCLSCVLHLEITTLSKWGKVKRAVMNAQSPDCVFSVGICGKCTSFDIVIDYPLEASIVSLEQAAKVRMPLACVNHLVSSFISSIACYRVRLPIRRFFPFSAVVFFLLIAAVWVLYKTDVFFHLNSCLVFDEPPWQLLLKCSLKCFILC